MGRFFICEAQKGMDELLDLLGVKTKEEGIKVLQAYTRTINALTEATGTQDPGQVVGVVSAWKSSVEREKALSAELSALKATQAKAEASTLLDGLVAEGRLEPAARASMDKLYDEFGIGALRAAASALPAASKVKAEAPSPAPSPSAQTADDLTDDERLVIKATGASVEDYLASKKFVEANRQGNSITL